MKTYTELQITEAEYSALQVVRAGLLSGVFIHKVGDLTNPRRPIFDMNTACGPRIIARIGRAKSCGTYCGTVACIGGWVFLVMKGYAFGSSEIDQKISSRARFEADYYVSHSASAVLSELYYPKPSWSRITPEVAAQGILNFLNTGDPDWESALELEWKDWDPEEVSDAQDTHTAGPC